jgi:hypothetical protein
MALLARSMRGEHLNTAECTELYGADMCRPSTSSSPRIERATTALAIGSKRHADINRLQE